MLRGYFDWGRSLGASHSSRQLEVPFARRQRDKRSAEVCVCKAKKASKKKAPKSRSAKTPIEDSEEASAPPRVDPNSNVPVRRQQQWAKTKKAMECNTGKTKFRQSYRKEKLDADEQAEEDLKRAEAAAAAEKAYRMGQRESLRSLRNLKDENAPPVLLIDGYNILKGYRAYLRKNNKKHPLVTASSFEEQRQVFQISVCEYSDFRNIKCVIVYDAMRGRRDPNSTKPPKPERVKLPSGVDIVWCRNEIADYWIIREVQERKEEFRAPYVCVATDDREIINDAYWAPDSYHISGETMIDDFTEAAISFKARQELEEEREKVPERPGAQLRQEMRHEMELDMEEDEPIYKPGTMRQLDAHLGIQELLRRRKLRKELKRQWNAR